MTSYYAFKHVLKFALWEKNINLKKKKKANSNDVNFIYIETKNKNYERNYY